MIKENVKPKTESLSQLFDSNNAFIIPAYQRPYEWTEEQIEQLLDNICDAYEINEDSIYLLGTIQFNILNNKKEIIDGHQRITTLYLLEKCLGKTPKFKYKNEISNNDSIEELIENNKVYRENLNYIEKYFSKGERKDIDRDRFLKYLNENIVFITISINECESIDDTLKVFDTLNTTGLSLQIKDIFKIKFSDYIAKKYFDKDRADIIRRINESYDAIVNPIKYLNNEKVNKYDSIYNLTESDLLDAFRFYLISQMSTHSWSTEFRQSNSAFFEETFNGKKREIDATLEDFCNLAECIKETQNALRTRDLIETNTVEEMVLSCSRELLDWSGYSRIKNLYYYIVFDVYKNNNYNLNNEIIKFADTVINSIWRYCSILRFVKSKIVNDAFYYVGKAIFEVPKDYVDLKIYANRIEKELFNSLKQESMILWCDKYVAFKELLNSKGNVFDCNKPHLLMFLSYIDDAFEFGDRKPINTRGKIGYWIFNNKQGLDIEHILSHDLYTDELYVNSIGNLIYLPSSINRALGKKLTTYNKKPNAREIDFQNKIEYYKKDDEGLASVGMFLSKYKDNPNFINIRNNEKIAFLKNIYNYKEIFNDD